MCPSENNPWYSGVAKLGHSVTSRIFVHFVGELDMDLNELEPGAYAPQKT